MEKVKEWSLLKGLMGRTKDILEKTNLKYSLKPDLSSLLAKRLCKLIPNLFICHTSIAQCLNPDLPAGLHNLALDLYSYVFNIIKVSTT